MKKILFVLVSLVMFVCSSCGNKYKEITIQIWDSQFGNNVTTFVNERNDLPQGKELMLLNHTYLFAAERIDGNKASIKLNLKLNSVYLIVIEKKLADEIIKYDNYKELIKLAKQSNYFSNGLAIYRIY